MVKINKSLIIKVFMYISFMLGAIVTTFIIYKNINNEFADKFVIGYLIIVFLLVPLYFLFISILNMRRLNGVEIRKRFLKFIGLFILYSVSILVLDYFFRPSKIDYLRTFSISLSVSYGMSFYDLFKKRKY